MRKILDIAAVVSLVLSGGIAAIGLFGYIYISSPANQEKLKGYAVEQLTGSMGDLMKGAMPSLPKTTGPAVPSLTDGIKFGD